MSETCTTLWNGSEMIGGDTAADASNIVYTNAANIRQTVKGALDNGAMIKMPYEEYNALTEAERNAGVYEVTGCPDSYADRVMLLETQAEYDALTEAEKLNGTSYFVKQGEDQFDAKNIHYSDPTGETTNAGDALDKLNNNLTATDSTKFRFATDGEGNYGYLKADDSFVPFKSVDPLSVVTNVIKHSSQYVDIVLENGKYYIIGLARPNDQNITGGCDIIWQERIYASGATIIVALVIGKGTAISATNQYNPMVAIELNLLNS